MSELRVERKENMAGGKGHVIIKHILEEKELNGKCKMYAEVTLEPGCSLGYHEHHNESETYYILRGEGNYDDNGRIRPVKAGDVTFTPDGMGHGLTNTGDTDLVFISLHAPAAVSRHRFLLPPLKALSSRSFLSDQASYL
jgi:mannose-6-phosphate isomerase-like protein (cupin superfamily)